MHFELINTFFFFASLDKFHMKDCRVCLVPYGMDFDVHCKSCDPGKIALFQESEKKLKEEEQNMVDNVKV